MDKIIEPDGAELRRRYHDDLSLIMATDEGFVCAVAIMCTASEDGEDGFDDISSKYSRGTFKRAIARIRMVQHAHPEFDAIYEKAVAYIRREWLHREEATV